MPLYLGPVQWVSHSENATVPTDPISGGSWNAPPGTTRWIDLRGAIATSSTGNTPIPTPTVGLFECPSSPGSDYDAVPFRLSTSETTRLLDRAGLLPRVPYVPNGSITLRQLMLRILCEFSDAEDAGDVIAAPTIRDGGIIAFKHFFNAPLFRQASIQDTTAAPLRLLRTKYARIRQRWLDLGEPPKKFHLRWLAIQLDRLGVRGNDAARRWIQADQPDEKELEPQTSVSEAMTGLSGAMSAGNWEYPSGKNYTYYTAGAGLAAASSTLRAACANTQSLSSDDHWAEIEWVVNTIASSGPAVRCNDPTSTTLHDNAHTQRFGGQVYLSTVENAALTNRGNTAQTFSAGDVDKIEADADDYEVFVNTVSKVTASYSGLSSLGALQVGFLITNPFAAGAMKNFAAADLGGSPVTYNASVLSVATSLPGTPATISRRIEVSY